MDQLGNSQIPQNRVIMHIDMNAFFASVEQSANKFIRYLPVAVGNPHYENTALVAVSYEARARGVRNLARGKEAREVCPDLIIVPFDPIKYYSINRQIVKIFREYTPSVEVYSIDEAFIDLTELPPKLTGRTPEDIAIEIKQRIIDEVGPKLRSSVGIAPNKLLAKVASNWHKPDGLTTINWDNRLDFLDKLDIGDVWGIGYNSTPKLKKLGVNSTKDIRQMDTYTMSQVVGGYYTRLQLIANGEHYDPVTPDRSRRAQKSMQHAHTLGHTTTDTQELLSIIRKMSERLAKRLRKHNQITESVFIGLKPARVAEGYGWNSPTKFSGMLHTPFTNNGKEIYHTAKQIFNSFNLTGNQIRQVYVGVGDLHGTAQQLLKPYQNNVNSSLDLATDKINNRFGAFTIRSGDILYQYAKERELSIDKENMVFHPE